MDDIQKTEKKIRKWLLVSAILFALFFAGMLIYYIAVHERWQLWAPIAALMLISAAHAARLYRFIKHLDNQPLPFDARNRSSGTTVAQAELQLSAPGEQAGRRGPGTG